MKKIFFFFAMLASIAASATVTITPLSTDYANNKVTFRVSWTGTPYNNRVWVWVDLCPVTGTSPGTFAQAIINNPSATAGSITTVAGNTRGFYVTTNPSTVTAILSNATGQFNWCAYGSDYPPNATAANETYILKGTPPFIINGNTTLGSGVNTYSGGCITSLTDQTGYPGIINNNFSAGVINNGNGFAAVGGIAPAAITSNTEASSGGGITYRWVRSGTSSATYADNNAGHSFVAAEINTAGTWTYYREVRDNTCATTTWNRSSGSYKLTVITCPYTGSDLYMDATHLCQQRTSGAKNWEAYIKDSRDGLIYRITQFSNNSWWFAEDFRRNINVMTTCDGRNYYSITNYPTCPSSWALPTLEQGRARWGSRPDNDNYGGNIAIGYSPYPSVPCSSSVKEAFDILVTNCGAYGAACIRTSVCQNWQCNAATNVYGRIRCYRVL
jgi:hypothetical protein